MNVEIFTKLTNKEIEESLLGDLNKQWEVVSSLDGNKEFLKELDKIKLGIKCLFDIRSITEGEFEKKVAFEEIWIERKKHINLTEFRDEIDERKKLMKEILRSLYNDDFDDQHEAENEEYDKHGK